MQPASIYLDHNATTPLDPEVLGAMTPYFLTAGNAESRHSFGRRARRAWDEAKETVAEVLGADPAEVIFTSGGTEANNLAVFGLAGAESSPGHVVSSVIEHPAVVEPLLNAAEQIEKDGDDGFVIQLKEIFRLEGQEIAGTENVLVRIQQLPKRSRKRVELQGLANLQVLYVRAELGQGSRGRQAELKKRLRQRVPASRPRAQSRS